MTEFEDWTPEQSLELYIRVFGEEGARQLLAGAESEDGGSQ